MNNLLIGLVGLPLLFAVLLPLVPSRKGTVHFYGIAASAILFILSLTLWCPSTAPVDAISLPWFPSLGISFSLGFDGLSSTMVILTTFLLFMAAIASISNITKRVRLYYGMLFLITASVIGVFLARDAFLFFLSYEFELIPMYLLIAIWGGANRQYAATKFALYTLLASVFMFAAILIFYFFGSQVPGIEPGMILHFDTIKAVAPMMPLGLQTLAFVGFFIAFSVKLPVVPFHTWLPDAHVEAPTPVSMLLAGILLKMGAYGMFRLCWEFLPEPALQLAPWIALLAVINIVYTAGIALIQKDLKKLIAYSSVSHMGFVLLGLASMTPAGFTGAIFVMFAHGIVSAALFMCVGTLYTRTHTRQIAELGGFGAKTPAIFYFFMFMAMASLGLPLLISFASETLVFYGAFNSNFFSHVVFTLPNGHPMVWNMQLVTILSGFGIVIGAAYLLWMLQRVFFGPLPERWNDIKDMGGSEAAVLLILTVVVIGYGFFPTALTKYFEPGAAEVACHFEKVSNKLNGNPVVPMGCEQRSGRLSQVPATVNVQPLPQVSNQKLNQQGAHQE